VGGIALSCGTGSDTSQRLVSTGTPSGPSSIASGKTPLDVDWGCGTHAALGFCAGNSGVRPLNLVTSSQSDTAHSSKLHRESRALVDAAVIAADAKLAEELVALDVSELLGVVDYFVIASGRNSRQVSTLVDSIEEATKAKIDRGPLRVEGVKDATWVLMDYGDVVVHVFLDETRRFYDLEHLWSGAPRVDLSQVVPGVGKERASRS